MSLHSQIVNLRCQPPAFNNGETRTAYRVGHCDARNAAAELASEADAALSRLRDTQRVLVEALRKIDGEWQRQKGLFPALAQDGWMDLAVDEARAALASVEQQRHPDEMTLDETIDAARAIGASVEQQEPSEDAQPVAWGLFGHVLGEWVLQHPVRFSREDAEADRAMYDKSAELDVRPLYAAMQEPKP